MPQKVLTNIGEREKGRKASGRISDALDYKMKASRHISSLHSEQN